PNDLATVLSQLQALAAGPAMPIVRPPWNEPVMVKRLLDLGAFTLLFPMVQSAEEAAAAVAATRYPPDGIRGVALSHRGNRFGQVEDYFSRVGAELCVLVQIETRAALERIDEIAAVDGVDGAFFGPADLSADMGLLGQPGHPEVSAAIALGFDRMRATGKAAGILTGDPGQAAGWLQAGFTFVACGSDTAVLARGTRSLLEQVRQRAGQ
ncbi:MAG: aldolase/citrate lyase family protein, partial [Candidatus Competibacterales bacterium]|nr:aldolase/citrate lyase family protein [Candidatus Competibacterales bacterium]